MAWLKGEPHEGILAPDFNDVIRDNNAALEAYLNKEHIFSTGGVVADQIMHKQGSARPFFQDTAPATRADGSAFASTDLGMLWIDSNSTPDNQLNILTATTPTWTPVSTEIIATLLASARTFAAAVTFDVAAILSKAPTLTEGIVANDAYLQGRNVAGDGNIDLIKVGTNDLPTLPDSAEMASSAAPVEDEAIANKKYVDDQITANAHAFGAWAVKSASTTSYTAQATTDGIVTAFGASSQGHVDGFTDSNANPTTQKTAAVHAGGSYGSHEIGITMPVKKNDYYKVTSTFNVKVEFLPIGG